jgi:predicted DCC family thiol-disulfide oxidoreductase YuxK
LVKLLETLDRGQRFTYTPMQDQVTLDRFNITTADCERGMILIDANETSRRWQGSEAAEEIGQLLPMGALFVNAYRSLPGLKQVGDRVYEQVRDNRYAWFGQRTTTYQSAYSHCDEDACQRYFSEN